MFGITLTATSVIRALIEILFLAYCFYRVYVITSPTSGYVIVRTVIYLVAFVLLVRLFRLEVLSYFASWFFIPAVLLFIVLYQSELKHGFTTTSINRSNKFKNGSYVSPDEIDAILDACYELAHEKRGALIVLPRNIDIQHIIDTGTKIDANLSSSMILTIFDHDTPFHDGAIVVRQNKIVAAACYLTLSEQTNIRRTLGTRHRAALGLSEESDALVVVVSEETQKVSVCFNGEIRYDLTRNQAERTIKQYMMFKDEGMPSFTINKSDSENWEGK